MNTVSANKVVFITYSILDEGGSVVEQYDMPVGYVQGADSGILPGIEAGLEGHQVGDRVEIKLAPEDSYGERDENLVIVEDIDNVPPQFRHIGAEVVFQNEKGDTKAFYVTRIEDGKLTIDGNHSHAGQTVTCLVNVIEIRDATAEEIRNGRPVETGKGTTLH
jgi:FKBP-type peptidyl-prolyl cis-trans isomerase SlyD